MKPLNRKEVILDAIANGKAPKLTPETREEAYLKKIAEHLPHEAEELVNEPLNITWDGNTEGLVSVSDGPMGWYKVSDLVFTDEEIKLMTITTDEESMAPLLIGDAWDEMLGTQIQVFDDLTVATFAAFVRTDGAMVSAQESSITFPEKGIYFAKIDEGFAVSSLTTTEPVPQPKTVVHKLDKKYLPDDVGGNSGGGGGVTVINLTWSDAEGCFYSEKTRDEIKALVKEGKQCVFYDGDFYSSFINGFGDAIIAAINKGVIQDNYRVSCQYYHAISVSATTQKVTLEPIIGTPKIVIGGLAYDLSVGDNGVVIATELTSGDIYD